MKKYVVFLLLTLMLIISGCQGKDAQKDGTISPGQNISNSSQGTSSNSTIVSADESTKSASTGDDGKNTAAAAGNTSSEQKNKTETSSNKAVSKPKGEQKQPEAGSFTLFISKNRGSEEIFKKKLLIKEKKSLMDYLRDNVNVLDDGGFVKSIEGLESVSSKDLTPEQKGSGIMGIDWFIYQNGAKSKSGADDIVPKNGDIINLDYREWTYKDMAP